MFTVILNKKIYYELSIGEGSSNLIVIVHGWGGSHKSMRQLSNQLKNVATVRFDLPGFGQSDFPDASWGVQEYACLVGEFIKFIKTQGGFRKIIYFGHSFGGSLGIYLAATQSGLFNKLILCASAYRRETKIHPLARILNKVPHQFKLILYKIFLRNSDLARYPHLESNFRKLIKQDLTEYIRKIKHPTLILWGDQDAYTPVALAYEIKDKLPQAILQVYPGVGHNLPIIHSDLLVTQVRQFCE